MPTEPPITPARTLPSLLGATPQEITDLVASLGEPGFRAKQIIEWTYAKRAVSIEAMSSLSKPLRQALSERYVARCMTIAKVTGSADTTQKFLFRLHDGRYIETVPNSNAKTGAEGHTRTG